MEAVAFKCMKDLRDALAGSIEQTKHSDPVGSLLAIGRAYLRYGEENRGLFKFMFADALREELTDPAFAEAFQSDLAFAREAMANLLSRGGTDGPDPMDVQFALGVVWGLIHGLTLLISDRSLEFEFFEADTEEVLFERTLAAFLTALGPRVEGGHESPETP